MGIITILASMLVPALQEARAKAKFARWRGYSKNLSCDDRLIAYWDFQDYSKPDTLKNVAVGPYGKISYRPERVNGELRGADPEWAISSGRWTGKNAILFGLGPAYLNDIWIPEYDDRTVNKVPAFEIKGDLTIETWFKHEYIPEGEYVDNPEIFGDPDGAPEGRDYRLYISGGYIVFQHGDGDDHYEYGGGYVADGNWHHVVFVADFPNYYFYVDGNQTATGSMTVDITFGQGAHPESMNRSIGNDFRGYIDEIAFYNSALTAEEVKQHYRMGKP